MTDNFKSWKDVHAPIRDEIAYWMMVLAGYAHNLFAFFSFISPNHSRAFTTMKIVPEKDGIRFGTVRRYNGKEIKVSGTFFMKREDLMRAIETLEKEKNDA